MFLKFLGFFMLTFAVWIGIGMISDHITQYPFRYRVTVQVDTPDGVKSGSSVVEALYFRQMIFQQLVGPRFPINFKGEATFVDLGGGRNVVLTVSGGPAYLAVRAFQFPWGITRADSEMRDAVAKAKQAGPKATPLGGAPYIHLPMMVTFRDVADPKSVELVDPHKFAATFGPGYALKTIIIEASDEPISEEMGQRLPWFQEFWDDPKRRNHGLDGSYFSYSVTPFMISGHYLKREK